MARLQDGQYAVRVPAQTRDVTLLQNVHTGSEVQPASYSMGTGFFPGGETDLGVKFPIPLHRVPRCTRGAIRLLLLYVFVVWKETTLLLHTTESNTWKIINRQTKYFPGLKFLFPPSGLNKY